MNRDFGIKAWWAVAGAAALVLATVMPVEAQQTGTIQGRVIDSATQRPLAGASVSVPGTQFGMLTQANGRFQILSVPTGDHVVRAELIGYAPVEQTVTVREGEVTSADFALEPTAIALREVVVTGVAGATPRAKLPITVASISAEDIPVARSNVLQSIQGRVAGAQVVQGSGQPGTAPSILLRGPTSIDASGRSQEPLYIVDGVVMGASLVDIDGMDIETIEVVKGAAAASMYGARAANGVIQITTRRGQAADTDQVRYIARSEYGRSSLEGRFDLTQAHQFAMEGNLFVDADGSLCEWLECSGPRLAGQRAGEGESANQWNTFQTQEWPVLFDHIDLFFNPGDYLSNYFGVEGRSGRTNYHASLSHLGEEGVMPGQSGFNRYNFRLNLDQNVRDNITMSGSAFYSRSDRDAFPESQGNPLFNLTRVPGGADLRPRIENGDTIWVIRADPNNENDNPLYEMLNRQFTQDRTRFLGSVNLRWSPLDWLDLDGGGSVDQFSSFYQDFHDKGFQTARPSGSVNEGRVYKETDDIETFNTAFTATATRIWGDLTTRSQLRHVYSQIDRDWHYGLGSNLGAVGVPSLHNVAGTPTVRSQTFSTRYEGFFFINTFDFRDRYILDVLARRDGSSLFGADERWANYFRVAGAYRITEEPWFNVRGLDELKLRYSYGTAGNAPNFAAQYETYSVLSGVLTPVTLGNRELKPERAAEQEFGIELLAFDRVGLELVYAATETRDQILNPPLPGFTGFARQWVNAGTLRSNTIEAVLNARLVETPDFRWSGRVLFDRTRQHISELNIPAYTDGVSGQAMDGVFYVREGERLGTFYGRRWVDSCSQLVESVQPFCNTHFQINDDGYMVFVGEGGSWRDGNWGTTGAVGGQSFTWGLPVLAWDNDPISGERTQFLPIGNTQPDYSLSFSSDMNWRGVSLYALVDAVQGFDIYNQPLQWATFQNFAGIIDQRGKPEDEMKPLGYYARLYNALSPTNNHWVEDGSFVKLRELSLRYRFGGDQLRAAGLRPLDGLTLSVTGRNLITWSDYNGYDPEVGRTGGGTGSAALARVDGYNYPNFRTWTFGLEVNF